MGRCPTRPRPGNLAERPGRVKAIRPVAGLAGGVRPRIMHVKRPEISGLGLSLGLRSNDGRVPEPAGISRLLRPLRGVPRPALALLRGPPADMADDAE